MGSGYEQEGVCRSYPSHTNAARAISGLPKLLKLHSARTRFATCARQLEFSLEERTALGHWKPGSLMPNLYDRAVCATELKLRNKILEEIKAGWEPVHAFEIPNNTGPTQASTARCAESPADSTSVLPTSSSEREGRNRT